jgi:hypothetical protein
MFSFLLRTRRRIRIEREPRARIGRTLRVRRAKCSGFDWRAQAPNLIHPNKETFMFQQRTFSFRRAVASVAMIALSFTAAFSFAQAKFPTGSYSNRQFTITFNEDGTHTVSADGAVAVKGGYTVANDQIVLLDKEGQYACEGAPGKYRWKLEDKNLKFEKIEDDCDGRSGALNGQTWVKQTK